MHSSSELIICFHDKIEYVGDAVITDPQGDEVNITAVEAGRKVVIYYDGMIAESYPAQIWSFRIQLMN